MSRFEALESLEEQRREAYVRAVLRAAESNDVVGYIGSRVPVELFHALGLMALPVYGVDGEILKHSREKGLCPLVDATLTYARTDRCPLIHSSRLIVVDDACPIMAREIAGLSDREVHVYRVEDPMRMERLIERLEHVYGRGFDEDALNAAIDESRQLTALAARLKYHSDLDGRSVYVLEYYLNFLSVPERFEVLRRASRTAAFSEEPIDFLPVRVQSGAGIYRQLDRKLHGTSYRIMEGDGCQGCVQEVVGGEGRDFLRFKYDRRKEMAGIYDYVYPFCPFGEGRELGYEAEFSGGGD